MTAIKQEVAKMREVRTRKRTKSGKVLMEVWKLLRTWWSWIFSLGVTLDRRSKRLGVHHKLRPEEWREGSAGLQE